MNSPARIRFTCIHCDKKLSVLPAAAGRTLPCPNPKCGEPVTVPTPDAFGAPQPAATTVPAENPATASLATASKPGAMVMIAAALSMLALGAGVCFLLMGPTFGLKRSGVRLSGKSAPVKALAKAGHEQKPAAKVEAQRRLAAANEQKTKEAQKEQAARKKGERTLSEYATLARAQSFEFYHNNRRVIPRWHRPDSPETKAMPLTLARYDDDIPAISKLVFSRNDKVRKISASILESHAMTQSYYQSGSSSTDKFMAPYRKALTSGQSRNEMQERLNQFRGGTYRTQGQVDAANFKVAYSVFSGFQEQRKANRTVQTALNELIQNRNRITYALAKELAGPEPEKPAPLELKVETFTPGENAFRPAKPDLPCENTGYCITISNHGKRLTHCSIAVITRCMESPRSADGTWRSFGGPFGLDEFTEAVIKPDVSRTYADEITLFYIDELKIHDRVHFLGLDGYGIAKSVERIGVILFSDQTTVVGDPNPSLQEIRDKYLTEKASNVQDHKPPRHESPLNQAPRSRLPAGSQSSRTKAGNAPRRR